MPFPPEVPEPDEFIHIRKQGRPELLLGAADDGTGKLEAYRLA